ncbi:MAG: tetratricopeptide repeat protein [Chloroflexi bacterium]|nr:tetratricopeptide repeat protein [Chloroflexota bacterium]
METSLYRWIRRQVADEIFERIISDDNSLMVYTIQGPAGIGKTFLARDLGTRLGSATGYASARYGRIRWSGILDVYDSDTNSNSGIERCLLPVFEDDPFEFQIYHEARELFDVWFKSGILGSGLEEQRHKVEAGFAEGMKKAVEKCRPVIVLDTIERLENALDPTQIDSGFFDDTTSVMGWLLYQISELPSGVVLLFGRRAERFYAALQETIATANQKRSGKPIQYQHIDLTCLNQDELPEFFAHRKKMFPALVKLLDKELEHLMADRTGGNPLLLDLALQTLIETHDTRHIKKALAKEGGMTDVEHALIEAYQNSLDIDQQALLRFLALARNGLYAELVRWLEPSRADILLKKLGEMEDLPFVKVREIAMTTPSAKETPLSRRTYFLHDAMYTICEQVLFRPRQVIEETKRILGWFTSRKTKSRTELYKLTPDERALADQDTVESLFYRMRVDPVKGYEEYLQDTDHAIRTAQTGLDMRLRDSLMLFLASAMSGKDQEFGQALTSPIDQANIAHDMPQLFDDFLLDSAMLWVKRYSVRGNFARSKEIGDKVLPWAETLLKKDEKHYRLAYAELLLWYAQTIMYGDSIVRSVELYTQIIDMLRVVYPEESFESARGSEQPNEFEQWRLSLVLGRAYNNLGYYNWLYNGKYKIAIRQFQRALRLFRIAHLNEEIANTSDNMGRVYAHLGHDAQAIQLIKDGLELRRINGLTYREALSRNSLAQAYLRLGQFDQAFRTANEAILKFKLAGVDRGIGLGLLTRGSILRSLGEAWREQALSIDEAFDKINLAETDLRDAVQIFTYKVKEPIRQVQARNEIGCSYRARYFLLRRKNTSKNEQDLAFNQARQYLRQAIELARTNNYCIDELDSVQDLAVLFYRAERYEEARKYLEEIDKRIPDSHKFGRTTGIAELPEAERLDAYYKLMGQIELLYGAIEYISVTPNENAALPSGDALVEIVRRYLLATAYYQRYADKALADRVTYNRIYNRFKKCQPNVANEILNRIIPMWVEEYKLPKEVGDPFRDMFGMLKDEFGAIPV